MKRLILIFLISPALLIAQYERPGSTGGQFLSIGVSPRAAAMGGAFITTATGAEATYYNPAAAAYIENVAVAITHTEWFANINHEFAGVVKNMGRKGSFGLILVGLTTDEMLVRTPLQPDGTGETFYAGDYRIGLMYAREVTDHVSFGGTINYIYSSLYKDFAASAVSADIAVIYITNVHNFRFGMKIENFGSELKFINEAYPLPTNFQFGMSTHALEMGTSNLLLSMRAMKPNDGKPIGSLGLELDLKSLLLLRAGYQLNNEIQTWSSGLGCRWKTAQYTIEIDYSYSNFSLLGGANRIGLNLRF